MMMNIWLPVIATDANNAKIGLRSAAVIDRDIMYRRIKCLALAIQILCVKTETVFALMFRDISSQLVA